MIYIFRGLYVYQATDVMTYPFCHGGLNSLCQTLLYIHCSNTVSIVVKLKFQ